MLIDDFLNLSLGDRFEQQLVNAALIALHEATIAHVICQLCNAADKWRRLSLLFNGSADTFGKSGTLMTRFLVVKKHQFVGAFVTFEFHI